jgi:hypothetical protein
MSSSSSCITGGGGAFDFAVFLLRLWLLDEPFVRGGGCCCCCSSGAASSLDSRVLFLVPLFDTFAGGSSWIASLDAFRLEEEDFFAVAVGLGAVSTAISSTSSSPPIDSRAARSLAATVAADGGLPLVDFLTGRATGCAASSVFAFFDFRTN